MLRLSLFSIRSNQKWLAYHQCHHGLYTINITMVSIPPWHGYHQYYHGMHTISTTMACTPPIKSCLASIQSWPSYHNGLHTAKHAILTTVACMPCHHYLHTINTITTIMHFDTTMACIPSNGLHTIMAYMQSIPSWLTYHQYHHGLHTTMTCIPSISPWFDYKSVVKQSSLFFTSAASLTCFCVV